MSRRVFYVLAACCWPAQAPAAAQPQEQLAFDRLVFQLSARPRLSEPIVYKVYLPRPGDPEGPVVQRGNGNLGEENRASLRAASCEGLPEAISAAGRMPAPSPAVYERTLRERPRIDPDKWRDDVGYEFDGYLRFSNGAIGEMRLTFSDPAEPTRDKRLLWVRSFRQLVDACFESAGEGGA